MSVYLSMKFSDKVYTCMYWVHACIYFYSWFFVLIERAHTYTYWYVWAHMMCNCFVPACSRPLRLHPAGPPAPCWRAAHSKAGAFVEASRHTWSRKNKCIIMLAATGLAKAASSSAAAEPLAALAAPASGSELDSYVVWATNLHLNVVARGRAPEIDRLYPPSWDWLDRQVQQRFCYGRECAVMMLNSLHKSKQLCYSHSAFKRSTTIEEHQNWSCVAGQKLIFRECSWIFHSVTSPCVPLIDCFDSIVFEPTNSDTHVYWEPSFSKTLSNENS
jgi:hypothetical protein